MSILIQINIHAIYLVSFSYPVVIHLNMIDNNNPYLFVAYITDNCIDCRHIKFIAKCILKKVMNYSFNEFMSYVKPYRKYLKESNFDYSYVTKNREIKF